MVAEEWQARQDLACAYRLFDALGWHELVYNHITLRVPGTSDVFLINRFGLRYREITASNLVKINLAGHLVDDATAQINPAGFVVHSAVHAARHDVACVMHTHTTAGMAVACLADGLEALSFPAMFYTGRVGYHDFEGITLDIEECGRLASSLGCHDALILRNHGLLTCGPTIGDCFAELYHLQRACEVQVAALSMGRPINRAASEVAVRCAEQYEQTARNGDQNGLLWEAMRRWMTETDASYLN